MEAVCSECMQLHYSGLVDVNKYIFVCVACSNKPNIALHPEGYYCRHAYCSCGLRGPVNFLPNHYWCTRHPDDRIF